jgi:hypothetical protein
MNPIRWKPEHRAALGGAAGIGAVLGVLVGYIQDRSSFGLSYFLMREPLDTLLWGVMGAIVVGGTLYVWRLFSH